MVGKSDDQFFSRIHLNLMQLGDDLCSNVGVSKVFGNFKGLSKDVQFPITTDKPDERNGSFWDEVNIAELKLWGRKNRDKLCFLNGLKRCFPFEVAVPMVLVMKEFKVLRLRTEIAIAPEPLGAKESAIVGVIEALHGSVPPRFPNRDKHGFDAQGKTKAQDDPERTRMAVAAPKTEFVVDLEEVGDSHGFPAADEALGDSFVVFPPLGVNKDPMAVEVDDVKGIESSVVLDVPRAEEVGLMDVVECQSFAKVGVFHSFGLVRSFF